MQLSVLAPPRAAQDTRLLAAPARKTSTTREQPRKRFRRPAPRTVLFILAVLLVVGVTGVITGLNISGSPHYESDEGTYVASAWSMLKYGKLSYYTYNYDHPPLGWFVIGLWSTLVGGFTALGSSIATARVLMVIVSIASAVLVMGVVRRTTGSLAAGVSAALLFAVSPLGTALHRQVWLDNLATLWLLLSVYLLLGARRSLGATCLSALIFGLSFWTKEVMVVFVPAMLVLVAVSAHSIHRRFSVALWATTALGMISLFVLFALLKDELLPPGVLWSSTDPHVSLLDTYAWQASRGGAGSILSATSQFRQFFDQWWQTDPTLVVGGIAAAVLAVVLIRFAPIAGAIGLLALTYLAFLARGGVVLYYYIIPVLALLAVVAGLLQGYAARLLGRVWAPLGRVAGVLILVFAGVRADAAAQASSVDFTERPTVAQDAAAQWTIQNLPHDSVILMDSYAWVELRDPATTGGQPFNAAHYYWPGVTDPSVLDDVLHQDWRTIDYVAISPSGEADIANRQLPIMPDAIKNSDEIQTFYSDNWSVRILRIRKLHEQVASTDPFLMNTWTTFKNQYVRDGEVVSPSDQTATSDAQANSLLRAVYADDQTTFDQIWGWTQANLQVRQSDSLLARQWGPRSEGDLGVLDARPAAGADEDTATALLLAAQRWNDPTYEADAQAIINDVWANETAVVGGQRVLLGEPQTKGSAAAALVNPSYFAPYEYRIFQQVDPNHQWNDLVDSSYSVLGRIRASSQYGGSAGVVPNWIALDSSTGELTPTDALDSALTQFDYQSSQVSWRLALDWLWFKDDRAKEAMAGSWFAYQQLADNERLAAAYTPDGQPAADYEATSMYAATLPGVLVARDRNLAESVFADKVLRGYHADGGSAYWGNSDDLNDQTWSWFSTALMDGGMANLWNGDSVLQWDEVLP